MEPTLRFHDGYNLLSLKYLITEICILRGRRHQNVTQNVLTASRFATLAARAPHRRGVLRRARGHACAPAPRRCSLRSPFPPSLQSPSEEELANRVSL